MSIPRNRDRVLLDLVRVSLETTTVDDMKKAVLQRLQHVLQFDSAGFFSIEDYRLTRPYDFNIDSGIRQQYVAYYGRINPLQPTPQIRRSRRNVFQVDDFVSRNEFEKGEYYCGYARRLKVHYWIGLYLRCQGELQGCISLNRTRRQRNFDADEIRLAEQIAALLAKPLSLHLRLESEQHFAGILRTAGDLADSGILIVDRESRVLYRNARAAELLASLEPEGAEETTRRILEQARSTRRKGSSSSFAPSALFTRGGNKLGVEVKEIADEGCAPERFTYLFRITEDHPRNGLNEEAVRRAYRLSRREIEIIRWMARGLSNKEIAERLYVSPWTVTTHVRNIFSKMLVHNRMAAVQKALGASQ